MRKVLCFIIATVFSLSVGLYTGLCYASNLLSKNNMLKEQTSETIAIINLDEGISDGTDRLYYSNTFIDLLDAGFVVESYSGANSGLEDGRYGAIITFPADTSSCISSLNSETPQALSIEYRISTNIDNDTYMNIVSRINEFKNNISSSLSYMYVSSILSELHNAQDLSSQLLSNNDSILTSLTELELMNYVESLDLEQVPSLSFEPEGLEINNYLLEAQQYAGDISQYYISSYENAQRDFDNVQNQMENTSSALSTTTNSYYNAMTEWRNNANIFSESVHNNAIELSTSRDQLLQYRDNLDTYTNSIGDYASNLELLRNSLNQYYLDLLTYSDDSSLAWVSWNQSADDILTYGSNILNEYENNTNMLNDYSNSLQNYYDMLVIFLAAENDYNEAVSAFSVAVESYYSSISSDESETVSNEENQEQLFLELQNALANLLEKRDAMLLSMSLVPDLDSFSNPSGYSVTSDDYGNLETAINDMQELISSGVPRELTLPPSLSVSSSEIDEISIPIFNNSIDEISIPSEIQMLSSYTLPDLPTQNNEILDLSRSLSQLTNSYDPLNYLSDDVRNSISNRYDSFSSFSHGIENNMNNLYNQNIVQMGVVVDGYSSYVSNMRTTAINTYNEEQNSFADSISEYGDSVRAINSDNAELIGNFSTILPHSRIGNDVNSRIVDAIVAPVQFEEITNNNLTEVVSFNRVMMPIKVIMLTSGVCILLLCGYFVIKHMRVNQK